MRRLALPIVLTFMALGLTGCPPPAPPVIYPPITFTDKAPLRFDVAEVRIEVPYSEPVSAPHVGQSFPVPPLAAARRWAEDRIRAVGRRGVVTVTIREAGAVEVELERSKGLKGLFTKEQAQRYEAVVSVVVEAYDRDDGRSARAETVTRRSITVPEDANVNERDEIWYALTRDMMTDFDRAMEAEIRKSGAGFLR